MSVKRSYKLYPDAFKEEAVALVTEQGYSVADAAQSLGIRPSQLFDWKAKQESKGASSLPGDERRELVELRKQNKQLRKERDSLKKASAFFAKEMKRNIALFNINQRCFR